jgi:hypothetical protein
MESPGSWKFWLILIVIILLVLWLFLGRRGTKKEFVGIKPLLVKEDITAYREMINEPYEVSFIDEEEKPMTIKYVPTYKIDNRGKMEPPVEMVKNQRRVFRSRGEELCCQIMEKIYGVPFSNMRLSCLRNPESGCNLEIDCYNETLKIGVEYNGEQHYIYPNKFHRTREEFISQVRRDQYKVETCDREGIYLITVPYNVELNKIEEYIRFHLPDAVTAREQI